MFHFLFLILILFEAICKFCDLGHVLQGDGIGNGMLGGKEVAALLEDGDDALCSPRLDLRTDLRYNDKKIVRMGKVKK